MAASIAVRARQMQSSINPAGRLLDDVAAHARARGVALTGRTSYRNTIPVQGQGRWAPVARVS